MKKIKYIFYFFSIAIGTMAQTATENYILTRTYTEQDSSVYLDQIQYFDGLGRPIETVQKGITPYSHADLATYTEYDGAGREYKNWLPIVSSGNGAFVPITNFTSNQTSLYNSDTKPYATTNYEPSPLNRITGKYGPGESWYAGKRNDSILYQTNVANEVVNFYVNSSNYLVKGANCLANTLYKTVSADEDRKTVTEYKDKQNRVVMKRNSTNVDTYYVYNDLGQLAYVLPPIAADSLTASGQINDDNGVLKRYGYVYKYDERGNCIYKRLPGCEPIIMVYDKADRLVLSQDGNQRNHTPQKWTFMYYDSFGRIVVTSEVTTDISEFDRSEISNNQLWVYDYHSQQNFENGYCGYYTGSASTTKYLTINYYDSYDFLQKLPNAVKTNLMYVANSPYDEQHTSAKGLLTGKRTYYLDGSGNYMATAIYYDYRGQVVQTRASNHLGGFDISYNQYNFSGQVTKNLKEHNTSYQSLIAELYTNVYDHAGRLKTTYYRINTKDSILLVNNTYDELGRLIQKKRHNNTDIEEFDFNIRNWTERIKSGTFEQKLYYNTDLPTDAIACFNGNIAAQTWTYNDVLNNYVYKYDNLNRLEQGGEAEVVYEGGGYETVYKNLELYTYDKLSNINSMFRFKDRFGIIDYLTYFYKGNQLTGIFDEYGSQNLNDVKEYNGNQTGWDSNHIEMAYDANGNLIKDLDRDIVTIQYNILNLPEIIQFKNGNQIKNTYDASGQKLSTRYKTLLYQLAQPLNEGELLSNDIDVNNNEDVTVEGYDYVGNVEYNYIRSFDFDITGEAYDSYYCNRLYNSEGYTEWFLRIQSGPKYYYFRRDHIGNNREVWLASYTLNWIAKPALTVQRTQYYPSGLPWASNTGDNPGTQNKKFNGKEFIEMHGYDTYDYGARGYYAAIGRWTSVDPLAEKDYSISPYVYCGGNPVNYVDPNGKEKIISLDPKLKSNSHLINAANNYKDDKAIHIWAHGNSKSILINSQGKNIRISDSNHFEQFLFNNSKTWLTKGQNEHVTIILHSCETGKDNGTGKSFASKLSKDIDNTTVVAATEKVVVDNSTGTEIGSYKTKTENINGKNKEVVDKEGKWLEFTNGVQTDSHQGDWQPIVKPDILTGPYSLIPQTK